MVVCQKCNWENPQFASFCTNCGAPLGGESEVPAKRFHAKEPRAEDFEQSADNALELTIREPNSGTPNTGEVTEPIIRRTGAGASIRAAATVVDMSVPAFEERGAMSEKAVSSNGIGSGEAVDKDDLVRSEGGLSEPQTDGLSVSDGSAGEQASDDSSVGGQLKDLGSLDVQIEGVGTDDSVDGFLLSSADLSPIHLTGAPASVGEQLVIRALNDSSDEISTPIGPEALVIGRQGAGLSLMKDEYVDRSHARVTAVDGGVKVEDLGSLNGTWIRLRGESELGPGDQFMVGSQIFEVAQAASRTEPKAGDRGTRRLGESWRSSDLAVRRLSSQGEVISEFTIPTDGLRIGRRVGQVQVPDDQQLSTIHALLTAMGDGEAVIRDLSTSNGCWLKLRSPAVLSRGDAFITGKTVWRVGLAATP